MWREPCLALPWLNMNRAFGSIAAAMALSSMCTFGVGASEAGVAVPEKAFLFSYFVGNGKDGFAFGACCPDCQNACG